MDNVPGPLVSCLCVTEGRSAFMPWLLWCFDRQTWPHRELVIVDSSRESFQMVGRDDVRVVSMSPGSKVSSKRNIALQASHGAIITWFDDDNWQHPHQLAWLVEALHHGVPYAGACRSWFVELTHRRCAPYHGPQGRMLFNSAGFRREAVQPLRFREDLVRASDTHWMRHMATRYRGTATLLERDEMFFWLCYDQNRSNRATQRHFPAPLDLLKKRMGAEAWGDTDDALDTLRRRLHAEERSRPGDRRPGHGTAVCRPVVHAQPRHEARGSKDAVTGPKGYPLVGLMINATVMDVPFLDIMVRHMIAQARYPFTERTLVVDGSPVFPGKFRARPRATLYELDQVLKQLLADGVVDHIRDVDPTPARFQEIMERYFGKDAPQVPYYAADGGPIYSILFGIESMTTDFVLQMNADILFHTGPVSWVEQALQCMARDPRLWLMMTHPGPPGGPPGHSLGPRNARCATWDEELYIWRFRSATGRYFLCDRRQLYYRLPIVPMGNGCAPLEQCISLALKRHGAFRGNLGDLTSWHLHAWYHGHPFPLWAGALTRAIEVGRFPQFQRGEYDLRLDRVRDRREWEALLQWPVEDSPMATKLLCSVGAHLSPHTSQEKAASHIAPVGTIATWQFGTEASHVRTDAVHQDHAANHTHGSPLAVVIPIRNRAGQRVRNALRSLHWQAAGPPAQVLVVSHGSRPEVDRELAQICDDEAATLIIVGNPSQPWNKPLALNTGIRATPPDVPFVMTMDTDMILAPNFLGVVLERLSEEPPALVLCQTADLPPHAVLPCSCKQLLGAFDTLRAVTQLRPRYGTGGIQAARRAFFVDIRGYDEDLVWWGAMDGDLVNRARLLGLEIVWIEDRTTMLHQWHPRKHAVLSDQREIEQAKRAWRYNHQLVQSRSNLAQRNPYGWGGVTARVLGNRDTMSRGCAIRDPNSAAGYGSRWHGDLTAMMSEDDALYTGKTGPEPRDVAVRPAQASVVPRPAAVAIPGAAVSENLVTVSIPYYRCKPYIRKVVESILAQTHRELQLIVVNDGDDQPPWAELAHISDPRLVRFDLRANHGRYFADAVVLNAVDSPYFTVQDADDWSEPQRIAVLLRALREAHADAVISAHRNLSPQGEVIRHKPPTLPLTSHYIHRGWHHGLFRRESLQRIGGYYGGFRIAYDVFLMNLLLMTGRVAYVDQPLYNRWLRAESLENAAATGMRSPLRAEVHRRLDGSYADVFKQYQAYLQGSLSWAGLIETIRTISARYLTTQDQTALAEETERLRALLETRPPVMTPLTREAPPKTGAPPAAVALESRLSQLLHSPQLPWKEWAISKTVAVELVHRLWLRRPQQVLEVGSGISTVLLAQCAAELGASVTTLEHDPISYQRTSQLLADFGLQRHVDLRLSPLTQHPYGPGECYFWYDTPLAGHYDFVFINGPSQKFGRQAVLLALADHLTPTWEAWLHDGHRAHEQQCLTRWQAQLPFTSRLYSLDAKGLWILSDEALPASFCFPASLTGKLGMSILTGQRLDLLKQAVQSLQIYAQELLEQSYVLVMVNGNDPPTNAYVDTLPFVNQILRHQGSILPIGTATSRLMQKLAGHAEYLIHLEDDWCISSLDQRWVESAAAILSAQPEIGQVRLRHRGETVLPYHMITRKPILWRWQDEFLLADQAHFTFNPHMLHSRDVPRIYPCQTEADAQHHFVRTELASAQLSPGIFRHIGAGKSLRQKLGRR